MKHLRRAGPFCVAVPLLAFGRRDIGARQTIEKHADNGIKRERIVFLSKCLVTLVSNLIVKFLATPRFVCMCVWVCVCVCVCSSIRYVCVCVCGHSISIYRDRNVLPLWCVPPDVANPTFV